MIIKPHQCKETQASNYQDQRYGKGFRVATPFEAKDKTLMARCTVSGSNFNRKGMEK